MDTRLLPFGCKGNSRLFPFGRKPVPSDKRHFVRLIKVVHQRNMETQPQ
ncbi:hypothetical protein NEIPOLOT_02339 [Neisseria polysaccharea ATCC 43768]|nr:hypothetical protein NEIPOLOT_02339 [Neisseria polysaccharea ATCC 43768]